MNENEFELDGKRYRAVAVSECVCTGCAFFIEAGDCKLVRMDCRVVDCFATGRKDRRNVIFTESK